MAYSSEALLVRPRIGSTELGLVNRVTPAEAQWKDLEVELRRLGHGQRWTVDTGEREAVIVLLGGIATVTSNRGEWQRVGRRPDVFSGMPWALYLPRRSQVELVSQSERLEFACALAPSDRDHQARLVTPAEVAIELRGGGSNSRQINGIVPPGFDCHRLVAVEVYTPSGNWSSYPPHKHDVDNPPIEADLDEIYYFRFAAPDG